MSWENKHIKNLFDKAPGKNIAEPTDQDWQNLQKKLNSKHISKSIIQLILKYAAIFIIIIGISGLVYYLIHSQKLTSISKDQVLVNTKRLDTTDVKYASGHKKTIKNDSSINPSIQHDVVALNMKESIIFENLVAANYRNNNMEVVSPLLNQQFTNKQDIVFKLTGDFYTPLVIKIYNNKGTKIYTTNSIQTNSYTLDIKLSKGLYYWKLERNTNLIYVGKFVVK